MFPEMLNHVREIMVTDVATTSPESTLAEAAKIMEDRKIGSLVVIDRERVVGILTERDFLRMAAKGYDSRNAKVLDGMSKPAVTCEPTTTITEAFVLMRTHGVRHLPVIEKGRLVGIVSLRDLISVGKLLL